MFHLELTDFRAGYVKAVGQVLKCGVPAAPRGAPTTEVRGCTIELYNPYDALPVGVGRKVSTDLALAEALSLVGEFSDAKWLGRISKSVLAYVEPDTGEFWGGYGARARGQLQFIQARLQADPMTRRAYVNFWQQERDLVFDGKINYPCMTNMQFTVRDDALEAFTIMRANDAWHGLAYDVFVATQLQISMANSLALPAGSYHHMTTSLHVYNEHKVAAVEMVNNFAGATAEPLPASGLGREGDSWWTIRNRARQIREGILPKDPTDSEVYYMDRLAKYSAEA